MNCTHCGKPLREGAKFCDHCAFAVDSSLVPQPSTNPAPAYVKPEFAPVTIWIRLLNFVIDRVFFFFILFILGILFSPIILESGVGAEAAWILPTIILLYLLYFIVFESVLQVTPAKFITRSKVVMRDGSKPPFLNILGRTFARIIPFEPFSFLVGMYPSGWHDKLSKTLVVPKHYSADDVRKIDLKALKGQGDTATTIVLVIVAFFVVIAVIGVLSSVVLVSLNSARNQGRDAKVRSTLLSIRPAMEVYYMQHGEFYPNASNCYQGAFGDPNLAQPIASLYDRKLSCVTKPHSYSIVAELPSNGAHFCIDSNGYADIGQITVTSEDKTYCSPETK